jgi:leucyl aminopeptidase (aminopeptidase T)
MKTPTTPSYPIDNGALAAAADVVLDRLGLCEGDAFLVVSNPELVEIATELAEAARARTQNLRIEEFPPTSRDGEEPPDAVATAMSQASAIAIVTRCSLSHTQARMAATRAGARIASMPGITADIFARTIPIDYPHLERVGRALASKLTDASVCRVTAPGGTDIELSLHGREAICDDGDLLRPGAWGNLPAGEAFIAPLESAGRGTIVFDGSLAGWGLLEEPLSIELAQGRAVTATGGAAAEWLLRTLRAGGDNGRTIAELGIATNPGATITGAILEDEKAEGTVHFAFGTNTGIGGLNQASVHIDGLVREAKVELDGRPILRDGRLLDRVLSPGTSSTASVAPVTPTHRRSR